MIAPRRGGRAVAENRLRGYRAIGYARDEAPLGFAPPCEEPTIEYDEEVLRQLEEDE